MINKMISKNVMIFKLENFYNYNQDNLCNNKKAKQINNFIIIKMII